MEFNTSNLVSVLNALMGADIRYEMNRMVGKVRNLAGTESDRIRQLDCSGFVEYVIFKSTVHNVNMPSGSRRQRSFFEQGHTEVDYASNAPLIDNTVRVGFRDAEHEGHGKERHRTKAGHVWLVVNGTTFESTSRGGRRKGPKCFAWSARTKQAEHFFTLGPAPNFAASYAFLALQKNGFSWLE
ncbi:MAG: hypothetical protein QNK92_06165 [Amylibacter sp.]